MEFGSFLPIDQRYALAQGRALSGPARGAVVLADLAGSTRLMGTLTQHLGPRRAVETLGSWLNTVFGRMVDRVHAHRGTVTGFGGDAITCWFPAPAELAGLQCALEIRDALRVLPPLPLPSNALPPLGVRIGVCAGEARRCVVGDPAIQRMDVLAGRLLSRVSAAERVADPGHVMVGAELQRAAPERIRTARWCERDGEPYADVEDLLVPVMPRPWEGVPPGVTEAGARWLHPVVQQRLDSMGGLFFDELRSPSVLFLRFGGIDYDHDAEAENRLDAFVRWAQGVLEGHEGQLLQVVVDEKGSYLYGAFGALLAHEDDPVRAVETARRLVEPPRDLGFVDGLAAGVSRGPVYAGAYGAEARRTYGVLGHDVNVAARLMEAALPGQVLVTEAIRRSTGATFRYGDHGGLSLRGLPEPLPSFVLSGRSLAPVGPHIRPGKGEALVGRDLEASRLAARLDALVAGEGGAVVIEGEAGIGKSRLVADLWSRARAADVRILAGAGEGISQGTPYHAWRPVVADLLGIVGATDPAGAAVAALRARGVPDELAPLLDVVAPLGLPESDLTRQMPAEVRATNTRRLLVGLLRSEAEACGRPLLLVLEDAYWMDGASWATLHDAHQELPALLAVVTLRPKMEEAAAEARHLLETPGGERILLDRLDGASVDALACQVLGALSLSPAARDLLRERAAGNPFLVQELARDLQESGRLAVQGGVARLSDRGDRDLDALPRSVQDIIASRVDRLAPDLQAMLKVASVFGGAFPGAALRDVIGPHVEPRVLEEGLAELVHLGILREAEPEGMPRHAFQHILTSEAVYGTLLDSQRATLHRSVAQWWEAHQGTDPGPLLAMLAHHWERAGDDGRAVGYLDRAAAHALDNFANDEAARLFTRAFALRDRNPAAAGPDRDRDARWELGLGTALVNLLRYKEALPHVDRGMALLGHAMPSGTFGVVMGTLWQVLVQAVHRLFPRFFVGRRSGEAERLRTASRTLEKLAELHFVSGDPLPAYYAGFAQLNTAEAAGPCPELARAYASIGFGLGVAPMHRAARFYLGRAMETARAFDDLSSGAFVDTMAAFYGAGVGHWSEAEECVRRGLATSERLGNVRQQMDALTILTPVRAFQGDLEEARDANDHLLGLARHSAYPRNLCEGLYLRAWLRLNADDAEGATRDLNEFDQVLRANPKLADPFLSLGLASLGAEAARRRGDPAAARELADRALAIAAKHTPSIFSSLVAFALPGEVLLALREGGKEASAGVPDAVLRKAAAVSSRFAQVFPIGEPASLRLKGRVEVGTGRSPRGLRRLAASAEAARRLSMPIEEGRACVAAARACPPGPGRDAWIGRATAALERPGSAGVPRELALPAGTQDAG